MLTATAEVLVWHCCDSYAWLQDILSSVSILSVASSATEKSDSAVLVFWPKRLSLVTITAPVILSGGKVNDSGV